jgi:hypothetical protein
MTMRLCTLLTTAAGLALGLPEFQPAWAQPGTTVQVNGALRGLGCRGKEGIRLRVHRDPSPNDPSGKSVTMVLEYTRPSTAPAEYLKLQPGECSWNPGGAAGIPTEPGRVYFDVLREAQLWSALETRKMDTTVKAAAFFPDPISLPRYLGDPRHYWMFFVDDASQFSSSFGAYRETEVLLPRYFTVTGPLGQTAYARKDLRCRGGSGLTFSRSGTAGTNLIGMTLSYAVSRSAAGDIGRGLTEGTCAWSDRTGMNPEPGRVWFTTPANAQLRQTQSGTPVDRTPNAAERYADANTIPVYMADPAHYWTFSVWASRPDSAVTHGVWKPSVTTTLAGDLRDASPAKSSPKLPGARPSGNQKAAPPLLARAPLQLGGVNLQLDRFTITFSGRPNVSPEVLYSTEQPVFDRVSRRWNFPQGGLNTQRAGGSTRGFRAQYTAWPIAAPRRGTLHYYIITHPGDANGPEEQLTGQFTTLAQHARVVVTRIDLLYTRHADLGFRLYARDLRFERVPEATIGGPKDWKIGSHSLSGEIAFANAPDKLYVGVWGDTDGGYTCSAGCRYWEYVWFFDERDQDHNAARGEFNIGVSPTERYVSIPFVMRSIDGNYLMFEVHGQIQVTRK